MLRRRAICQGLEFGAFSAFWTSITYQLIDVNHLSQTEVGIFALVGAAGAAAAPLAGRVADGAHGQLASAVAIALGVVAMVIAGLGANEVIVLAIGAVLLDLSVQGHQVLSQRVIYALRGDARARINTVFMSTVFIGGAISSAIAGWLYQHHGWGGVTAFAACLPAIALVIWAYGRFVAEPREAAAAAATA